jgi:hypothetical protein
MAPFIRDGDVITVSPLGGAPVRLGEVVAFLHPVAKKLVVHRVITRRDTAMLIQGDGIADGPDGLVSLERVLGRVTCVERAGRPVWLGLGPERVMIAWLSRARLLIPLGTLLAAWRRRLLTR